MTPRHDQPAGVSAAASDQLYPADEEEEIEAHGDNKAEDEDDAITPHVSDNEESQHLSRVAHEEYRDSLETPSQAKMEDIAHVQAEKEKDIDSKYEGAESISPADAQIKAAGTIQRNYRGYRERRQLHGIGLDPSTRWQEAIKEARYRNLTRPRQRAESSTTEADGSPGRPRSDARHNWRKVAHIAQRAGGDDVEPSDESEQELTPEQAEEKKKRRNEERRERDKSAKMMDLQYFLEMVDMKHRYGSNLRTYHDVWKKTDTNENFFYWLDHGAGLEEDLQLCPRERLDRERVRYLSREERLQYLIAIDQEGRLCWAKNGERIDTSIEYKDSINGIVHVEDSTPAYAPPGEEAAERARSSSSASSPSSTNSNTSSISSDSATSLRGERYVNPEMKKAKGPNKVKHVSAATVLNHLLRKSVKKNTWIFVADTSFRLYVGIKQSGAFQHSSFLNGARISAAGLIKVKDGQLRSLSPLSGHYRPPTRNFRSFVHSLGDAGVDMSRVSISKSYAVLVGLEAYVKTRRKVKRAGRFLVHKKEEVVHPEALRQKEEENEDHSKSAQREREVLRKGGDSVAKTDDHGDGHVSGHAILQHLGIRPKHQDERHA